MCSIQAPVVLVNECACSASPWCQARAAKKSKQAKAVHKGKQAKPTCVQAPPIRPGIRGLSSLASWLDRLPPDEKPNQQGGHEGVEQLCGSWDLCHARFCAPQEPQE
eukprot:1158814-Pelagomonas_calceolata.AAC.2